MAFVLFPPLYEVFDFTVAIFEPFFYLCRYFGFLGPIQIELYELILFHILRMENNFQWLTRGDVSMPQLDLPKVERWIRDVAATHNRICGPLTYVFCDDPTILDVNRQFLSHDYFTDIITFDDTRGRLLRGDIFISLDTVRSNAEGLACEYGRELMRVIIHGVLHLCGINDKGPGEREIMEANENAALALWDEMNCCL